MPLQSTDGRKLVLEAGRAIRLIRHEYTENRKLRIMVPLFQTGEYVRVQSVPNLILSLMDWHDRHTDAGNRVCQIMLEQTPDGTLYIEAVNVDVVPVEETER